MSVQVTQEQVDELMAKDIDELLIDLAIAEAGSDAEIGLALGSLADMKSAMSVEGGAELASSSAILKIGKRKFNRVWPAVKAVICALYAENEGEGPLKGWVSTLTTAILAGVTIGPFGAAVVAVVIIKMGLDSLCAAGADAQPA